MRRIWKPLLLAGLLLITVWLAWQAPDMEKDAANVVQARHQSGISPPMLKTTVVDTSSSQKIIVTQRRSLEQAPIDLFSTRPQPPETMIEETIVSAESTLPELPFIYTGRLVDGDIIKIFVLQGAALHIVRQGDKVGDYQLKTVADDRLDWLYLPLNITQKMPIGNS